MFPQPAGKATGPAEFLPLLLSIHDAPRGDPLSGTTSVSSSGVLPSSDIPLFLADLAAGFDTETLSDVITPTLSLFFQQWFQINPTPNLMGDDWRKYLGAVTALTQVKAIAQIVGTPTMLSLTYRCHRFRSGWLQEPTRLEWSGNPFWDP